MSSDQPQALHIEIGITEVALNIATMALSNAALTINPNDETTYKALVDSVYARSMKLAQVLVPLSIASVEEVKAKIDAKAKSQALRNALAGSANHRFN